ncbi:hypothetical protein AaE_012836 [Aphanomyces astaci]|uniref:Methyltransferase small domain-containing protein n=2 Tax=Aphanomyces astaci TaxID=112090 RepID=A0A6A4ZFU5_APHAT|nr:hypothetical protein AaE_012836 [Aphanomyces astaci]
MPVNILDVLREGAQRSTLRQASSKMGRAMQSLVWRDAFINRADFSIPVGTSHVLQVRQAPNGEINGLGTGLTVWPAACVLLKYLEHHYAPSNGLQGKRVVELGCGTGAVGLAAAMLGAHVVLTDQAHILFHIQANVQANDVAGVEFCAYDWGAPLPQVVAGRKPVDIVLISDCVLPKLYPIEPLVDAINLLCASQPSTVVLVSFEHRYYEHFDAKDMFWTLVAQRHLTIRTVPLEAHHPSYNADDIEIWEITSTT